MTRLEQFPAEHYSAVLMDVMMPGLDGIETTRMIRANPKFEHLPIIALSADDEAETLEQCLGAGMTGHVAKPLDVDRLWEVLIQTLVGDEADTLANRVSRQAPSPTFVSTGLVATNAEVFDPRPLDRLKVKMLPERFCAMLRLLLDDCRTQVSCIEQCAGIGDLHGIRQLAHDLSSTAGHAGMRRLQDLSRELLRCVDKGTPDDVHAVTSQIQLSAADAISALEQHIQKETSYGDILALPLTA
jgi:CheY-like chemotaxis protein